MPKHTPLHAWHQSHGARTAEFAGWDMPIVYGTGAVAEHRQVRTAAGLFDVSHMGQVRISGKDQAAFLERLVSSSVETLGPNQSGYGLMCRDDGGVIDDLFVYRRPDDALIVVNAANREKDLDWMLVQSRNFSVAVTDISDQTAMFALQGPEAIRVAGEAFGDAAAKLERFASTDAELAAVECYVGRTGYTGEDGVEIFCPAREALGVWSSLFERAKLVSVDLLPIGLAARDSLRFEAGFPLYGHELREDILPPEALLKWACDLQKDFIGADAVRARIETGLQRKLCTFVMDEKAVPRADYRVFDEGGSPVGWVTTGMFAPSSHCYAGNAMVSTELARVGTRFAIEIRGKRKPATVVKRPLYRPVYR
jgi:glycine cleavage system T protein